MERAEKVFWEDETTYKEVVNDKYRPFGIYFYLDEEIIGVEWFKAKSKRDAEYDKFESEVVDG